MSGAVLWTDSEAAAATGGTSARPWRATGVSIDSRSLEPGDLFVAIEGPNRDGHDFVADAFARGAAAAVVHRVPEGLPPEHPLLLVGDTLAALEGLGRAARRRSRARVVAVTGSVGKTSTKDMIAAALATQGPTARSAASYNNQWGVPLSLARMPREAAFGVFEIGMNHPGELTPLARLVRPDVAVVTTVTAAHLGHFASVVDIAEAKAEIFAGLDGGTAVLNRDNAFFALLAVSAYAAGVDDIVSFGAHREAGTRLVECALTPGGSDIEAVVAGRTVTYRLGAPGRHQVMNSLAALSAVAAVGADVEAASAALAQFAPAKGRGQRHTVTIPGGSFELIDESYNASNSSMRAAFEILSALEPGSGGRRIAALGDMLELGPDSPRLHAALAGPLRAGRTQLVYTAGPNMRHLHEALPPELRGPHLETVEEMARALVDAVRPGDVVLVKGSLGSRVGRVVDALLALDDAPPRAVNG